MLSLIVSRRFFPFFLTQALGAFNDNFFRNALIFLITFHFSEQLGEQTATVVSLTAAVFVSPFFLFSATAGRLADRFDKTTLIRWLKWTEIGVMLIAALGFWLMNLWLLLVVLWCMGTQSALFGPVKYAILPALLKPRELLAGNAWVEASTFVAILVGTLISSLLILTEHGRLLVSVGCLVAAVIGLLASQFIPGHTQPDKTLRIRWNIALDTIATLWFGLKQPAIRGVMFGIAWFWGVGTVIVSQLPYYAKTVLTNGEIWVPWLLASFTVGIAVGAFACSILLNGRISTKTVLPAALALAVFAIDFYHSSTYYNALSACPERVFLDVIGMAVSGGFFIVPLYTSLQHQAEERTRGRLIASSNIVNALAMTLMSLATATLLSYGIAVYTLIALWCIGSLVIRVLIK